MRLTYKNGAFIYMSVLKDSLFVYNPKTGFLQYENMSERQLKKVYAKIMKISAEWYKQEKEDDTMQGNFMQKILAATLILVMFLTVAITLIAIFDVPLLYSILDALHIPHYAFWLWFTK